MRRAGRRRRRPPVRTAGRTTRGRRWAEHELRETRRPVIHVHLALNVELEQRVDFLHCLDLLAPGTYLGFRTVSGGSPTNTAAATPKRARPPPYR